MTQSIINIFFSISFIFTIIGCFLMYKNLNKRIDFLENRLIDSIDLIIKFIEGNFKL